MDASGTIPRVLHFTSFPTMPLSAGDRLGSYEIVALIGAGGMGEVYRARDTKLGRDVAVKVLPAMFASDADRLARLEREARLISHVSHPNICTLFHAGETPGPDPIPFLVFELVEGETLQERLLRGALPVHDALRHAAAIAAALEAAHARGIIHRDLKPSNVKIAAGGAVKVLDFGLAKLTQEPGSGPQASDHTLTLGGTREGAFFGSVGYMSPEQAMGDGVDKRTDIWAFGCVLYEMLAGRRAFPGKAVADTLAGVMRSEPDWAALPAATPAAIRKLLRRCLQKDRHQRLADITDARLEINDALFDRTFPEPASRVHRRDRGYRRPSIVLMTGMLLVAAVVCVAFLWSTADRRRALEGNNPEPAPSRSAAGAVERAPNVQNLGREIQGEAQREIGRPNQIGGALPPSSQPSDPPPVPVPAPEPQPPGGAASHSQEASASHSVDGDVRLTIAPPDGVTWAPTLVQSIANTVLAVSPDGRRMVFTGRSGGGPSELWLRSVDGRESDRLARTEGATSPFWSPDGASIGFFADGNLKRLDLEGSRMPVTLSRVGNGAATGGATWGPDDTIVFGRLAPHGLSRVSSNGGIPREMTRPTTGELYHARPHFLPGTRQLIYRATATTRRNNGYYAMSLDSADRKLLMRLDAGNLQYAAGHLLFLDNRTLMAQPFDLKTLAITGPPRPLAEGIRRSSDLPPLFGVFSASQNGRLVYLAEGGGDVPMTVMANWMRGLKR